MNRLYRRCQRLDLRLKHVAEVGVYLPETSNILGFIQDGLRTTLVEADPQTSEKIRTYFRAAPHVTLHNVAVTDQAGTVELVRRAASTFLADIKQSPAVVNDHYELRDADRFQVTGVPFEQLDDGTIDLLSIDIEGAEWLVIKHLRSRPAIISVETHGKFYHNPHLAAIRSWMQAEGYAEWYLDNSDTVFVRREVWQPTSLARLRRTLTRLKLSLDRGWYHLKEGVRGPRKIQ